MFSIEGVNSYGNKTDELYCLIDGILEQEAN